MVLNIFISIEVSILYILLTNMTRIIMIVYDSYDDRVFKSLYLEIQWLKG